MLLAEALLLLLLDDEKGTSSNWVMAADNGLAGALLLELGDQRPSSPALTAAWDVVHSEDRPPKEWVKKLPGRLKPIKETIAAGLVERGVLDEERHKRLGLFSSVRYPELDPQPERELRAQLRAVLVEDEEPSPFIASLLGLLVPLDLVKQVVDHSERKDATARAKAIAERGVVGDAVQAAVREQVIAAVVAASAAATAATSSSAATST